MKKAFIFYISLFLLILILTLNTNAYDYDLWARLIAGMGFVDGGHVLTQDFLSYTPVHTWWDHEWGAGVVFYWFVKHFGGYSLLLLQAIMLFLIFFTASRVIKLRTQTEPYNIIFYFFALMAVLANLNNPIRCHMFSFLFFTLFIYIFEKSKQNSKLIYLCPFIILFWNNIHGGVVAGLGLMLMYALGEFLNKRPFAKYLIIFLICCPILLINPWGFDYVKFLIMANTMARPEIVEWRSPFESYNITKFWEFKGFFFTLLSTELIYIIRNIKAQAREWYANADKTKYIIILTTVYLSVSHIKLIPFFVIAALCYMYEDFYELVKDIELPAWKNKAVYSIILFVSLITLLTRDFSVPVGLNRFPVKEVEFIKQNNIKGKLLVDFGLGSYVSYKLYPNNLIFMDGRYEEVYYDYMVPVLKEFMLFNENWDYLLKFFPPDVMILEKTYKAFNEIQKHGWKLIYDGKFFGVFVPKNKAVKKYIQPTDDIKYYKNTLFTTDIKF